MQKQRRLAAIFATLSALCPATPPALAQERADLTGMWRTDGAQDADWTQPVPISLANNNDAPHGTYVSLPYVQVINTKDGLQFFSDVGAIWAKLSPVEGKSESYSILDQRKGTEGQVLATLNTGTDLCGDEPDCFQISVADGKEADFPLPVGERDMFVKVPPFDPAKVGKKDQNYGSVFKAMTTNFQFMLFCYDLGGMDVEDVQKTTGCRSHLFETPNDDSYSYRTAAVPGQNNAGIPYGWTFKSADRSETHFHALTIDTGRELSNTHSLDIGVKASVNLFGFAGSASVDVGTSKKLDNWIGSNTVKLETNSVETKFALIQNRYYTSLNPEFKKHILDLKGKGPDDPAVLHVLDLFGTHYSNATTFGGRGFRRLTIDEQKIKTLREDKTSIAAGMSANYAGNGLDMSAKDQTEALNALMKETKEEEQDFGCYGGTCNDGIPSGDDVVPIYHDLRPISDLLAPPFFDNDAHIYGPLRATLAEAIAKRAFKQRNDLDNPTLLETHLTNLANGDFPQLLCGQTAVLGDTTAGTQQQRSMCCNPGGYGFPVLSELDVAGADPVKSTPGDNKSLDGLIVDPSAGPVITSATVDYGFVVPRDAGTDLNIVTTPNLDTYCRGTYGDGWTGQATAQSATCVSGSATQQINLQAVCHAQNGAKSQPVWRELDQSWRCGFTMTAEVDINAYCVLAHGAGSVAKENPMMIIGGTGMMLPPAWICQPGGNLDPKNACAVMADRAFQPQINIASPRNGPLACTGSFAAIRTVGENGAAIVTYPDKSPYSAPTDAKEADKTTNVVIPLSWTGDAAVICGPVPIELTFGLKSTQPQIFAQD